MPEDVRETVTGLRRVIVSYDIHHRRRTEASLVNRYLFGHEVVARVGGRDKRYRYRGLIHRPGVERLGQSVFLLRERDAEDLVGYLARLRVPHSQERVWIQG